MNELLMNYILTLIQSYQAFIILLLISFYRELKHSMDTSSSQNTKIETSLNNRN